MLKSGFIFIVIPLHFKMELKFFAMTFIPEVIGEKVIKRATSFKFILPSV